MDQTTTGKVVKSDAEWRAELTPMQYEVLREHGTERAFTGELWDNHAAGTYVCAGCGQPLFASDAKFESGTGWPSFTRPISPGAVEEHEDRKFFMRRTEVRCSRCDGHLGHVFPDGPQRPGRPALLHELGGAGIRAEGFVAHPSVIPPLRERRFRHPVPIHFRSG